MYASSAPASSIENLTRAVEMAGHATACEYSCTADYLEPDYARWRTRRKVSFVPFLTMCLALVLFLT